MVTFCPVTSYKTFELQSKILEYNDKLNILASLSKYICRGVYHVSQYMNRVCSVYLESEECIQTYTFAQQTGFWHQSTGLCHLKSQTLVETTTNVCCNDDER